MQITQRLLGKQIAEVMTNGHVLSIRTADGSHVDIAWVDDNGKPIKGQPVLRSRGIILKAEGMRELIDLRAAGA